MISYKDMTFCIDALKCKNADTCARYFSDHERGNAVRWWGADDPPVAFMSFAQACADYEEEEERKRKETEADSK